MQLHRLLYLSFATGHFDMQRNIAILEAARKHNLVNGLTGVLLCTDAVFVQVLEGPRSAVDATYERICRDRRHRSTVVLARYDVSSRVFSGWQMGFYHLSSIEAKVGRGLIGNDDTALAQIIDRHREHDAISETLHWFLQCNARDMRFAAVSPA